MFPLLLLLILTDIFATYDSNRKCQSREGYFCIENEEVLCPEGFYCKGDSSPLPCPEEIYCPVGSTSPPNLAEEKTNFKSDLNHIFSEPFLTLASNLGVPEVIIYPGITLLIFILLLIVFIISIFLCTAFLGFCSFIFIFITSCFLCFRNRKKVQPEISRESDPSTDEKQNVNVEPCLHVFCNRYGISEYYNHLVDEGIDYPQLKEMLEGDLPPTVDFLKTKKFNHRDFSFDELKETFPESYCTLATLIQADTVFLERALRGLVSEYFKYLKRLYISKFEEDLQESQRKREMEEMADKDKDLLDVQSNNYDEWQKDDFFGEEKNRYTDVDSDSGSDVDEEDDEENNKKKHNGKEEKEKKGEIEILTDSKSPISKELFPKEEKEKEKQDNDDDEQNKLRRIDSEPLKYYQLEEDCIEMDKASNLGSGSYGIVRMGKYYMKGQRTIEVAIKECKCSNYEEYKDRIREVKYQMKCTNTKHPEYPGDGVRAEKWEYSGKRKPERIHPKEFILKCYGCVLPKFWKESKSFEEIENNSDGDDDDDDDDGDDDDDEKEEEGEGEEEEKKKKKKKKRKKKKTWYRIVLIILEKGNSNLREFLKVYRYSSRNHSNPPTPSSPSSSKKRKQRKRGKFSPAKRVRMARQIAEGLFYLHHVCKVVHRDIKPENIIICKYNLDGKRYSFPRAKICDFGSCCDLKYDNDDYVSVKRKEFVGTAEYTPPETLKEDVFFFNRIQRQIQKEEYELMTENAPKPEQEHLNALESFFQILFPGKNKISPTYVRSEFNIDDICRKSSTCDFEDEPLVDQTTVHPQGNPSSSSIPPSPSCSEDGRRIEPTSPSHSTISEVSSTSSSTSSVGDGNQNSPTEMNEENQHQHHEQEQQEKNDYPSPSSMNSRQSTQERRRRKKGRRVSSSSSSTNSNSYYSSKNRYFLSRIDTYSFGILCWELLLSRIAFSVESRKLGLQGKNSRNALVKAIHFDYHYLKKYQKKVKKVCYFQYQGIRPKIPKNLKDYYKEILNRMWAPNALIRPGFGRIRRDLAALELRLENDANLFHGRNPVFTKNYREIPPFQKNRSLPTTPKESKKRKKSGKKQRRRSYNNTNDHFYIQVPLPPPGHHHHHHHHHHRHHHHKYGFNNKPSSQYEVERQKKKMKRISINAMEDHSNQQKRKRKRWRKKRRKRSTSDSPILKVRRRKKVSPPYTPSDGSVTPEWKKIEYVK